MSKLPMKDSAFDHLTAKQLADFIDRHCLQIIKGGYAWRGPWEVNRPAPRGHYMECAEQTIAHGETATEALRSAYGRITTPKTKIDCMS